MNVDLTSFARTDRHLLNIEVVSADAPILYAGVIEISLSEEISWRAI